MTGKSSMLPAVPRVALPLVDRERRLDWHGHPTQTVLWDNLNSNNHLNFEEQARCLGHRGKWPCR
jgi:hypothetical protein